MSRYHDILGVHPGASQEEIKNAFRRRALECHPDRADDGQKEEAEQEFIRVREAFEILSDEEDREPRDRSDGNDSSRRSRGRRRSYKDAWKKYKDQRVYVGRDIVENVRGLSSEYDLIRRKNSFTIPICSLLCVLLFLFNPMAMYGTGIFLIDVVLCGLIGSVYGFALGSVWGYLDLFWKDFAS